MINKEAMQIVNNAFEKIASEKVVKAQFEISGTNKNVAEFMKMLAWIDFCGATGHTCQYFKVGVDGDGSGRLYVKPVSDTEKPYAMIRDSISKKYKQEHKDLDVISFE